MQKGVDKLSAMPIGPQKSNILSLSLSLSRLNSLSLHRSSVSACLSKWLSLIEICFHRCWLIADLTITLLEMNETLTKDLIFSRALRSLKEQYDDAYSAREDLLTSCTVSSQVRTFLQQKFERLRHQIGDTSVDMHRLERNARQDNKVCVFCWLKHAVSSYFAFQLGRRLQVKSALAKRIHALEKTLETDEKLRDAYMRDTDQEMRELDAKIKVCGCLPVLVPEPLRFLCLHCFAQSLEEIQEATYVEMETEIQQLKAGNKLLIKEVKSLRADLVSVQSDGEHTERQLAALQTALQGVMKL